MAISYILTAITYFLGSHQRCIDRNKLVIKKYNEHEAFLSVHLNAVHLNAI